MERTVRSLLNTRLPFHHMAWWCRGGNTASYRVWWSVALPAGGLWRILILPGRQWWTLAGERGASPCIYTWGPLGTRTPNDFYLCRCSLWLWVEERSSSFHSSSGRVAISAEKLSRCPCLGQGFRITISAAATLIPTVSSWLHCVCMGGVDLAHKDCFWVWKLVMTRCLLAARCFSLGTWQQYSSSRRI